ncbi:MAG: hypothetical protein R3301_19575, partial [Saprospiraceae bacterium]|nr:hypothetical protein [Saprospiraceae bacterium]
HLEMLAALAPERFGKVRVLYYSDAAAEAAALEVDVLRSELAKRLDAAVSVVDVRLAHRDDLAGDPQQWPWHLIAFAQEAASGLSELAGIDLSQRTKMANEVPLLVF